MQTFQKIDPLVMTSVRGKHCQRPIAVMVHYCEKLMGVVVFAKVQGQIKFESPRTRRVRGLSDFASLRTFVKTTTPIHSLQ